MVDLGKHVIDLGRRLLGVLYLTKHLPCGAGTWISFPVGFNQEHKSGSTWVKGDSFFISKQIIFTYIFIVQYGVTSFYYTLHGEDKGCQNAYEQAFTSTEYYLGIVKNCAYQIFSCWLWIQIQILNFFRLA